MPRNRNPLNQPSTKEKIFHIAVELFYESNYENVSIRDIAKAADVKIPTIYNHFESKEDILKSLYDFFDKHWKATATDVDTVLHLVETEAPHALLMRSYFAFDPAVEQTMSRIISIAARDINFERSQRFIKEKLLDKITDFFKPLLERMIELERIEPLDVDTFICVYKHYAFSAAFLDGTPFQIGLENWLAGMEMLFSLVKSRVQV